MWDQMLGRCLKALGTHWRDSGGAVPCSPGVDPPLGPVLCWVWESVPFAKEEIPAWSQPPASEGKCQEAGARLTSHLEKQEWNKVVPMP